MAIFDRGTKKWTAMMLPEHVKMLKELENDWKRTEKPILDEQHWQKIDERLHTAIEFQLPLHFVTWKDGFFAETEGVLHYIDTINKNVRIINRRGEVHQIDFERIIEVEFVD